MREQVVAGMLAEPPPAIGKVRDVYQRCQRRMSISLSTLAKMLFTIENLQDELAGPFA